MNDFQQKLGVWFQENKEDKSLLLPHKLPVSFVAKLAEEATEVLKNSEMDWSVCQEKMPSVLMVTGLLMADAEGQFACSKEGILQRAMAYGFQVNLELLKRHGLIELESECTLENVFELSEDRKPKIKKDRVDALKEEMNLQS
ncbi:MAG: hypothetical protein AB8C84_00470 [Oligoflexales bacterium]